MLCVTANTASGATLVPEAWAADVAELQENYLRLCAHKLWSEIKGSAQPTVVCDLGKNEWSA